MSTETIEFTDSEGNVEYDILIGDGIFSNLGSLLKKKKVNGRIAVITDTNVAALYEKDIKRVLKKEKFKFEIFTICEGETSKSIGQYSSTLRDLSLSKFNRNDTIVAIGGGVVGDFAGFVASSYMRGVNFVQVPTTLLAMVDSSIGGKVGINLCTGKNLVGAFYNPSMVLIDVNFLKTLPKREFSSGMAEIIKYALICNKNLFEFLYSEVQDMNNMYQKHPVLMSHIISQCIRIKMHFVYTDPFEQGDRMLLNFGHTVGHALETATDYKKYTHGEAIGIGMLVAAYASRQWGSLKLKDYNRIEHLIIKAGLPWAYTPVEAAGILNVIKNDKKVTDKGKNRWILLCSIGSSSIKEVSDGFVKEVVELYVNA